MLPLGVRRRLFTYFFRAREDRGLKEVPCFVLSDVAIILRIGWKKSFRFFRDFRQYRQNLRCETWSCLTKIYPRSIYLLYYYLLFWWAKYCEVWEQLVTMPDRSLIAELFIRYIVEIDSLIDRPGGVYLLQEPSSIEADADVQDLLREMLSHIQKSDIALESKAELCERISSYMGRCLAVCQNVSNQSDFGLSDVLQEKEETVGGLFRVWAALLCILCGVSDKYAKSSQDIMHYVGMAMQVMDDMLDLPVDYDASVRNIFYELLRKNPDEQRRAVKHIYPLSWKHLDGIWAQQNLPETYEGAIRLMKKYLTEMTKASKSKAKAKATYELYRVIANMPHHVVGV